MCVNVDVFTKIKPLTNKKPLQELEQTVENEARCWMSAHTYSHLTQYKQRLIRMEWNETNWFVYGTSMCIFAETMTVPKKKWRTFDGRPRH